MKIRKSNDKRTICFIAEDYPSKCSSSFAFVQQLSRAFLEEGYNCIVIAPQSITKAIVRKKGIEKRISFDEYNGKVIQVFRPLTVSFSNTKTKVFKKLTDFFEKRAIKRVIKKIGPVYCYYCYFWHIGLAVSSILKNNNSRLYIQASECEISIPSALYAKKNNLLNCVTGVICASRKNYDESVSNGLLNNKLESIIIPNGINPELFFYTPKELSRKKFSFENHLFVVSFVGGFIDRKGVNRLSNVLNRFDDVYSIFVGTGPISPFCKNILYSGKYPHDSLQQLLSCSDIFVLPTNAEGCCNAIIEALACGLPVISSNKSFNDEILDDDCSVRIDEMDEEEIFKAILYLKNNPRIREAMSKKAILKGKTLSISNRAKKIKEFIEK